MYIHYIYFIFDQTTVCVSFSYGCPITPTATRCWNYNRESMWKYFSNHCSWMSEGTSLCLYVPWLSPLLLLIVVVLMWRCVEHRAVIQVIMITEENWSFWTATFPTATLSTINLTSNGRRPVARAMAGLCKTVAEWCLNQDVKKAACSASVLRCVTAVEPSRPRDVASSTSFGAFSNPL